MHILGKIITFFDLFLQGIQDEEDHQEGNLRPMGSVEEHAKLAEAQRTTGRMKANRPIHIFKIQIKKDRRNSFFS